MIDLRETDGSWHAEWCCDNHADHECSPAALCWACGKLMERRGRRLAANLATAAGLEFAYRLGPRGYQGEPIRRGDGRKYPKPWRPGCHRTAPGWNGKEE